MVALIVNLAFLAQPPASGDRREERERMVRVQIAERGVKDPAVLRAMREVPRHRFVPQAEQSRAYSDHPLPIGYEQTISQPFIVAWMTALLELQPHHKVLEIGTGSGYQAAVLGHIARHVYTIEVVPQLANTSAALLQRLGHGNITVRYGDGYLGWREHAPFDRVLLTAAPPEVPKILIDQLASGGRLVAPVGRWDQEIVVIDKDAQGRITRRDDIAVRFVPMVPARK